MGHLRNLVIAFALSLYLPPPRPQKSHYKMKRYHFILIIIIYHKPLSIGYFAI